MSDLLRLARAALEAAGPGEDVEAYAEWSRELEVKAYEGDIESLARAESRGLGVRVVAGGRLGYAYAADPSIDEVAELVEQARTNAALASPDEGNVLPRPEAAQPLPGILLPEIESTPEREKVAMALELERVARAADPRVSGLDVCGYGDSISRVAIASTSGVETVVERGDCQVVLAVLASDGDETQVGFEFDHARRPGDLGLERVARSAVENATRLLGARKPRTERLPVLLDPSTAASFLGVLASALSAEAVLKGRSLFADKVGQRVASDVVELVDDGRDLAGPGASPVDDEGVPTRRTRLVAGGVLEGFLHNAYTAARMGATSTGNARRGGFKSPPGVAPTNLAFAPGSESREELLRRAGRALYVQELIGVHSGANPISGDFSVGVSGMMVEGGAFAGGVREAAIASTIIDVLGSIVAIGNDLRYFGSTGAPTVLVGEMTLAGT